MKVLVYGWSGYIANFFIQEMEKEGIDFIKAQERIGNMEAFRKEIDEVAPTHIFASIGRTYGGDFSSIDYLEDKPFVNTRDNLYIVLILCLECKKRNIHLTLINTGCIYTYDENHEEVKDNEDDENYLLSPSSLPFTEEDEPNFLGSAYSSIKYLTDSLIRNYFPEVLNLRIRMPVSKIKNKRNFITKIVGYPKINSIENSMTILEDLTPVGLDMMKKEIKGTFNFVNTGTVSHKFVLDNYKKYIDPNHSCEYVDGEKELNILAKRSNCFLSNDKLRNLGYNIRNVRVAMLDCIINYL